jgi:hypothetical protein
MLKAIPKLLASDPDLHMAVFITSAKLEDEPPVHVLMDDDVASILLQKIHGTLDETIYGDG